MKQHARCDKIKPLLRGGCICIHPVSQKFPQRSVWNHSQRESAAAFVKTCFYCTVVWSAWCFFRRHLCQDMAQVDVTIKIKIKIKTSTKPYLSSSIWTGTSNQSVSQGSLLGVNNARLHGFTHRSITVRNCTVEVLALAPTEEVCMVVNIFMVTDADIWPSNTYRIWINSK